MHVRWVMLAATLSLAFPAAARDWSPDEKAVWQLEEDYWHYVSAGDIESYVKMAAAATSAIHNSNCTDQVSSS